MTEGLGRTADKEIGWIIEAIPNCGTIIEVGTYHGVTAARIAQERPTARVISVDPFPVHPDSPGVEGAMLWAKNKATPNQSLWVGTLGGLAEICQQQIASVIFIDGDHSKAGCALDLKSAERLLAPKGVIFCHDYQLRGEDCAGVETAVVEFCQRTAFGITGAVHTTVRLERGKGDKTGGRK